MTKLAKLYDTRGWPFGYNRFDSPFSSSLLSLFDDTYWGYNPFARETDAGYEVKVNVAGYKKDELAVSVEKDNLIVESKADRKTFYYSVSLPADADKATVRAKLENGLLVINLSKSPTVKPLQIAIE